MFFRSASNVDEVVNYHYLASPYRVRFFRGDLALALYGVDFEADSVTLHYDQSNREFEIEIPIPEGVSTP